MDFTIRKMKKKDIPSVKQVARQSWQTTYEGIIPRKIQENFLAEAYSTKMMKHRMKQTNLYVAESDQEIIGFANYSPVLDSGKVDLHAIYLYKEFQGKGIGTAFLDIGKKELEAEEIILNVEKQNLQALHFYQAKGFKEIAAF